MVSKGFRNPTIREMYMFPPQNPDLKAESLMNYELSFTGQLLGGAMSYGVNLYYINGDNIIMTDPALRKNVNSGEIENWGVETNLGYHINRHWQINANYSWLHMENPVLAAPRAQTLCRCGLYARTLESVYRYTIREGASYLSHPGQGEAGKLRTLEPACQLPSVQFCRRLCQGRKPAGATL